jgi:hypothetical protein
MRRPDLNVFLSRFMEIDAKFIIENGKLKEQEDPLYTLDAGVEIGRAHV